MLTGTLDDFTLADVLRLVSIARKTGRLDVKGPGARGSIFFADGDVTHARSEPAARSLGEHLVERGILTPGQLAKAQASSKTKEGVSGALLASEMVSQQELSTAARAVIEDAVFELWGLQEGEFSWAGGSPPATEVNLAISVENLIMEATRRREELATMRRTLPADETVFALAPEPVGRRAPEGAISLTRDQWRVLAQVDGQRTVAEIAEASGLGSDAVLTVLHGLLRSGLIVRRGGDPHAEPEESDPTLLDAPAAPTTTGRVSVLPSPDWFEDPDLEGASRSSDEKVIDLDEVRRS